MVRETNNVCFGQIAQETQVVVREDNKRDHLKRSTEDVSPPNFTERNSGYYERSSRLVADTDSYIRRSSNNNNNNTTSINNYQSSGNSSNNNSSSNNNNNSTNNNSTSNPDNRSRTRDRLYINGPYAVGVSSTTSTTPPSATTVLSERTSSGAVSKINNSRVPPASWYEAAATYTNGPGGSGNADVSAANFNHYQTAASTEIQTATAATTNSTTTSSYTAYSYVSSSPAHNNTTTASATTPSSSRNTTIYGIVSSAGGVQQQQLSTEKDSETNISTTPPLLNRSKQKLLKSSSSRSGSASPTSTTTLPGTSTMTSSSAANASTSSSASATSNNNNNSSNQTANNSCSSISSTINSNTNNSLSGNNSSLTTLALTTTDNTQSGSNVSGILNAAALAAAASKGSSTDGHKNSSSSSVPNSSSNASATVNSSSNNPSSISASHHTSRSAAHFHGRSTTSSSRSHSRSPSSYSSSHSSSSSSSSTASSHSHASSPVGGRDIEPSSSANISSSRVGSRSLQSAVAVPGTSSALNPSGSNVCGSSSSSTSSTSSGTPIGNPVVHSEDNRPLAIRVRNLPARSSDTSLKDGLFHEYKKHGKVTWVKVVGQNAERYALVCFKKPEDVEKALEVSHDKLFFGCKIEVEPYQGYDVEDNEFRPYEAELDEYHPKSTRTLFIGNLEKEITASELRQHFECFGEIIEIDIKKQGMSAYAFCQYSDIVSVVKAMRKMDGEHLGNNRIKLGFGKSMPTNCVWIDGIGEKISESHLQSQFSRYGAVSKVVVDRQKQLALVLYEQIQYAQTAVKEMRGATLRSRKLQVDFASRECQDAFYEKLEKQSAGSRFNRYESQSRSRASSFSRHQNSNDGCSPSNTPGSSSSSSAGVPSSAPTLSSAIVAGASSSISASNTTGGSTLASVVGQASGNTTPARSRGSRSSRHTMDYDYLDTRRFRSYDEYSQGSAASQDEDGSASNHPSSNTNSYSHIGLRSDSPLLSRLGPIVNSSGKESSNEMLEMALSRRRCDKSPAKQKGDIRLFQKERAVLLEQLEECPSSGDESIVSPRKRIKIDHHSNISTSGLSQSHLLDEQQPQHKNSNCDYLLNDPMHRKSEVRRLSESSSLNKYPPPPQPNHHSHHAVPPPHQPHHHNQQQQQQPLSRRPSIDFMATTAGGAGNLSARHSSTSSSNSDHHPPPHQTSSLACKRRRVIGSGSSALSSTTLIAGSSGSGSNLPGFGTDDFHHHASRGRGHQLHSHHSHEASGGESADGSRPGTPLCDERPEVLPSEPRRVPRERPREPMVLPLPKFGIQFFQQYRNSVSGGNTPSYHHHHHGSSSFTSSSPAVGSTNSGGSHLLSNSLLNRGDSGVISSNSHSSLSHSSATTTSATATGSSSSGCYLPSPSTRYPPHWRPNNHHHHHHHHQQHGGHHGPSGGATPSSSSSMVSPMRSRSLSSNSSDSDVPGQSTTGSPSLEERIRTLDEMYERWSGGGSNSSSTAVGPNVVKRHDFNNTPPTWQHHRSTSQTDLHHHAPSNIDVRSNTPSTPASRHKFLDIDVNEMKPSDIVKSLLAKKSIFDDDLQRLKKNHWYEPTSDASQLTKNIMGVCTSPGLPNLQATKTPVVGCTTSLQNSVSSNLTTKPSGVLLQRLSSLSPMNSPQASMSPYSSPSPSPSVTLSSAPALTATTTTTIAKSIPTIVCGTTIGPQTPTTPSASTSPASAGGTKCLQYPFPTHPPLPNTAAPVQSAQPIPPPPAESSKPMAQPPLPPMEVHQPPQPPATSPTPPVSAVATSSKPKTSALSKSLSVPPPPVPTAATGSRILTKSVSVPGSTNVGTVKSSTTSTSTTSPAVGITSPAPLLEQKQPQQTTATTGSSSSNANKSTQEDDTLTAKPPSHTSSSSTTEAAVKRSEKSHKHNHRSSEDKRVSKNDRRKNSNSSQSQVSQASTCESSDADEHDSKKERKERQERREKELRKQQEREEREREEREREEKERLEKEKLEKERLEKERLERERLEQEERERVQREKERLRKEEEQRAKEERERKEKEEKERKLKEQREREESEKRKREESERQEREEQLRKENEQKEKEKLERQRLREEKERERKIQEETTTDRDFNLLKEHQRKKETAAIQFQTKTGSDMAPTATTQTAQDFFRHGESERQTNKENSTEESSSAMDTATPSSGKHKTRKSSRNTSPIRHPKRRLSSQDSNASNSANSTSGSHVHTDDHAKRMRIDIQTAANATQTPQMNNHNSVNNVINERRDSKEHHHVKERNNKHNRLTSSTTTGHKSNLLNSHDKEHNSKHHRNKHHHKQHATIQSAETTAAVSKSETETTSIANCINKTEDDNQSDNDLEIKSKTTQLLSSDDDEVHENANASTVKTPSGNHKHREHGSGGGHHSRHKSSKREREHHREKKRHSTSAGPPIANTTETVPSTPPPAANCNATDEEIITTSGNELIQRRTSAQSNTSSEIITKVKREHSSERKLSRSEDGGVAQQPQTPSSTTHRHSNFNKSTPQSSSRRMLLSSAEDTDGGGAGGCVDGMGGDDDDDSDNRQHSIFDIPDDGPYVSMYDKVKARSCKNMQKQEEEKKIKAKFSQLKQSRAKREEKKRSTSYDGDSDSDFEGAGSSELQKQNRSGGSYKMLSGGGLSSTDEDNDADAGAKTPNRDRRRSSHASSSANSTHPNRVCSDSDDNSITQERLKLQDNIRRLCDDGDETSDDDLTRRHNTGLSKKRLLHHTSRIASDSESQSASDIKLKQEPIEASNDGSSTPVLKHLKQKLKKEVDAMEFSGETSDFGEFKFKRLNSLCSSADEQATGTQNIKSESTGDLLSANEIKQEIKDFYATDDYLQSDQKFHKSPAASVSQHCSPEQAKIKKHKKSKKRQKTPTQDSVTKDQMAAEANIKHSPTTNLSAHSLLALTADPKSAKLLTSPCYDAFDELKRGDTLIAQNNPDVQIAGEKKRHKERKEKKREKLRHMSADVGSGVELDKTVHEKEKHRLKKSKKSKSVDIMRQIPAPTTIVNAQLTTTVASPSCTPQHKRSGGEKMEDIFGPISDEDDEDLTDSDIGGRDLNCITNRNTSSSNMTGPIVSAALNPYKQEPLTPKSHTQEENEENKQKLTCSTIIGGSAHLERVVERQHRKEKREKKRKEREKSRGSEHNQSMGVFMSSTAVSSTKPLEDENSVDLDAAGRALEAQLMEDSDNKLLDEATPSTATTHRSDMTDVFRFSDGDENSLEMTSSSNKHEKKDVEKEHTTATATGKNKEKKKKKKRSKEEKQLHHQRRESSSSNASQQMVAPSTTTTSKLTIDVQSATKHAQKITEEQQLSSTSESPLCKPSPSLPCLIGDDDDDDISSMQGPTVSTPNTSLTNTSATAAVCTTPRSSKDLLNLSPHMRDKQMISPIPKTPTISNTSGLNSTENINKLPTTPSTPTSSTVGAAVDNDIITTANTTPTSSISVAVNNLNKSNDSSSSSNAMAASSPTSSTASVHTTTQKKKSEIFIPGFDGEIDERISESAVQSISAEFNTPLDSMADEPKIPVESPPDSSKIEKLEESKSRVTISQEETESAVSALLGESFGNSSADYSFNDDDDDLNNVISEPEPVMVSGEPDEEAALAAKAIECEVASSAIADSVEDTEEVCKAVQCLRQEELDIKADTPQSVRDLQIDTDTEENADEADSSGSHSLKIDETAQSNNSSGASDKVNTTNPIAEDEQQTETSTRETAQQQKSSVITKLETPVLTPSTNTVAEPKIEPPTITKQDQPAVQPVQAVMPTVNEDSTITLATTKTTTSTSPTAVATTITTTTPTGVTMSYTSTPIKTPSFTFAPTSTCSSTPKQSQISISNKSITSSIGYVMQPPTITIPDTPAHFVVPQLMLSPKGIITTHHNDSSTSASSTSSSMHSPSGHHMPPQSPVGAAYMMGVRAQSPHSPRQHTTSRGNTPTPRQASPHTVTHTPPPTQQNIIVQRDVQQHQNLMSPPSYQPAHTGTQNNSPLSSPNMPPQRQQISGPATAGQGVGAQMQHSPNTPEQHMIKINNYSTPPSQNASLVNIRIPPGNQHQQQLSSPQQSHNRVTLIDGHQPPILGQHYAQNSSVLNIRMPTNQTQPQQQMQSHGPLAHGPIRLISPEQHPILGPYYAQNISIPNIRIPASQRKKLLQAHNNKLQSPHSQKAHPLYTQHNLPISVQKMPPVPTHPTIISKVVTVTPQQAQQSTIQSPGGSGQQQSPKASLYSPTNTSGGGGGHLSRSTPQILQQVDKPITTQTQQQQAAAQMQQQTTSQMQNMQQRQQQQPPQMQYMQQTQQQQHIMQLQQQQMMHQDQQQKLQQQNQHAYTGSQQQRLASPQQMQQQQQQTQMHLQQQQLKVQYQQHHMAQQMMQQSPVQQSPTPQQQQQQEQNVIQNISQTPQRFLVQQHIVGMPSQQQSQQQEHSSPTMQQQQQNSPHAQQQQSPNTQQKPSPIYSKQQHLQHLRQQSPSPQRVQQQQQQESKHNATETSRVLVSTTPTTNATEVATKTNIEKHSTTHSPIAPQQLAEAGVSVIRTPTPTRATVTPPIATPTNKESPSITPAANINMAAATRSAPLTEENVIKISPPKHDEMEQDSKEDSDYWSAKELNVVEQNNTSTNSVSSTVIKKNETLTSSTTTTKVEPNPTSSVETKAPVDIKTDTKVNNSGLVAKIEPSTPTTSSSDSQSNASNIGSSVTYSSQSVNVVTTDHDTEDETETQQMPTFEQVPIQGRPSTRGTGAKRGRQPRGGKKAAAAAAAVANVMVNANVNVPPIQTELGPGAGVQTRLRKPNAVTPATRGRKGRPPRNLLMQQQQLQQQEQPMPTPSQSKVPTSASTIVNPLANTTTPVLTSAEKKARNQATANEAASASVSESNQQQVQQNQDVYEFHEESGDESKAKKVTSTLETVNTVNPENRPRLILTIKSPAQGHTPLVKALEKPANVETKPIPPPATPVVVAAIETTQQETVGQTQQTELTAAELAAAAATRKSRRLLEKDRSTIDDIIEDVVRNTNTNAAGAGGNVQTPQSGNVPTTNVLTSTLPKGAQTPPRRSGRNSSQPRTSKGSEVSQTPANPIGRPRKSKDRKNTNDLMDIEQTPSPQAKQVVHDISDVEDTKSVTTPTPPPVQTTTSSITESVTSQTAVVPSTTGPNTNNSIPQHPKKKALAAAEIESYQISTTTPNIHSALPAGGVPMLNTAAPASQKTTGGVADSVNKPIIDPVTGTVSGIQMQQAKEGNLPSATAASQPIRGPIDPKKMMQAAVAAAAVENSSTLSPKILQNPTLQGSAAATPITALTKPIQVEATAAQAAATSVATAMLNKSVSVVVKTSTHPQTLPAPSTKVMIQQQQQEMQISHAQQQPQKATSQQMGDVAAIPIKQSIIMQQPQTPLLMHAQQTNVRPPTSLKAHVLNSQKFQQQQQQHQSGQQQYGAQQQSHQQPSNQSGAHQPSHVIQTSLIQRQTTPQQQLPQTPKQLLVNIPPPTVHSPHNAAAANAMNSPRNITQHTQQQQQSQSMQQQQQQPHQSLVIKQGHDLHSAQVLHVVSSKTSAAATTTNKSVQQPTTVHHVPPTTSQQQSSYTSYIQQTPTTAHSTLPHQPIVIHQQTIIGAPPSKTSTTTTPLVMPPGMLGLPPHPAMVIQTKTSAPARSPSASSSVTNAAHLQHPSQHTQSPPLQSQQHLIKQSNNPMIHSLQSQNVSHILNAVPSPSPPSTVKPPSQQSSLASNVAASSLRTAIPTISPQSQARMGSILLPGGMQVPHFEASMHDIAPYGSAVTASVRSTQSPPPAHQQASPITPSEASFPGGPIRGVPTREHLMIYQQLLRQHDPLNPATLREYDEKLLGSSPPLELRRPGSVPRTVAVPHSLQSPQDRATDSPQVAQVYVHNTRLPAHTHYDVAGRGAAGAPSAYYDATRQMTLEPPPAHRSASAHSVVAPPTVVVPHPSAGSSSPFMPAAPPASGVQTAGPSGPPPPVHHSKILEREREQREREQQLMREKEQVMVRTGDAHNMQVATPPPHQQPSASHQMPPHAQAPPPPQADSLLTLLQRYPVMWQGLLALKTDQAAVQMHFVFGNPHVARASLPCNSDGSTPPLRIAQRMRLEQTQLEGVAKKMQFENEHCMLLALPCGHDHADVLQQSRNLQSGFITYLQQKMAAGIVNIPMPGSEQAAYVVHIFPSCDFANENLEKAAPDLKNRVADIAHLLIVIATV